MELLPFFLILLTSVLFSVIFRKFHLPWVLALIIAGIAVGPSGLSVVSINPTLEFIAQIGLIFLMFMAGLETKLSSFKENTENIAWLAILNALIPLAVGFGIGWLFGFSLIASILLGIIFMSSSVAVIIPTLEANGLINTKLGRTIVSATILEDIASLVLLSILLQTLDPITVLPLPSFYLLLITLMIGFRYALPKLRGLVPKHRDEQDLFESEVRIVFVMLLGVVVLFETLGLHPIIAGFFAGLVLSDSVTSELLIEKLRTISYGIFVPVFFVTVGMQTDISVFTQGVGELVLVVTVVLGSLLAKLGSGFLGGYFGGFKPADSLTMGVASIPQLSTTLAAVFTAVELGIFKNQLITAMVILSIVTTLVAPILMRFMHPSTPGVFSRIRS